MECDSCQMLSINGMPCHETGCRNARATWNADRERWIHYVTCRECGEDVERGEYCECQNTPEPTAVEQLAARIGANQEDSDFQFGAYVFCMDYHGGQWSLEYAAMCEINASMRDNHADAIRYGRYDDGNEWEDARRYYRELKRNATKTN